MEGEGEGMGACARTCMCVCVCLCVCVRTCAVGSRQHILQAEWRTTAVWPIGSRELQPDVRGAYCSTDLQRQKKNPTKNKKQFK